MERAGFLLFLWPGAGFAALRRVVENALRQPGTDALHLAQLLLRGLKDGLYAAEMAYQRRLFLGAYAGDGGKLAPKPLLAAQRPVMSDAEAVRLVAHILHQMQRVGAPVQHDGVLPPGR